MITGADIYRVLSSVLPLYVSIFLGYASIRIFKILTVEQCAGVNRYVALIAVPTLGFQLIAETNVYQMNWVFLGADAVTKVAVLGALYLWAFLCPSPGKSRQWVEGWVLTIFMISSLPNTLVIGVPLLTAMYGPYAGELMAQIVVIQVAIWFPLVLLLLGLQGAREEGMRRMSRRLSAREQPTGAAEGTQPTGTPCGTPCGALEGEASLEEAQGVLQAGPQGAATQEGGCPPSSAREKEAQHRARQDNVGNGSGVSGQGSELEERVDGAEEGSAHEADGTANSALRQNGIQHRGEAQDTADAGQESGWVIHVQGVDTVQEKEARAPLGTASGALRQNGIQPRGPQDTADSGQGREWEIHMAEEESAQVGESTVESALKHNGAQHRESDDDPCNASGATGQGREWGLHVVDDRPAHEEYETQSTVNINCNTNSNGNISSSQQQPSADGASTQNGIQDVGARPKRSWNPMPAWQVQTQGEGEEERVRPFFSVVRCGGEREREGRGLRANLWNPFGAWQVQWDPREGEWEASNSFRIGRGGSFRRASHLPSPSSSSRLRGHTLTRAPSTEQQAPSTTRARSLQRSLQRASSLRIGWWDGASFTNTSLLMRQLSRRRRQPGTGGSTARDGMTPSSSFQERPTPFPPCGEESCRSEGVGGGGGMSRGDRRALLGMTLRVIGMKLLTNPNNYAALLGVAYSLLSFGFGFGMPEMLRNCIAIVGNTGLGMAMFSLGLFMASQRSLLPCGAWTATWTLLLRFVATPLLTAGSALAVGLRGTVFKIAVVQAALPPGIATFVFANEYNVNPSVLSTGVSFGTLISFLVLLVLYILLGL